jgi:hypothetical protein
MAISAEQLNVILSARDREFTRAMDRAQRRVERFSQQSSRNLMTSSKAFTALSGAARAFLPALSAGLVIQQVRRVVSELDNIGKTADRLGFTTDALQELRVAAENAGVTTQTLDMAMQRFGRRLAEARQDAGEAKDALAEMGIELFNADGTARGIEDVLNDVANAMQGMTNQTDRNRIAMKLFDSEGVALVNMLRDGAAGLEEMRQNARELGIVIDEDLIRNAEDAQQQLDLMSRVINANVSQALVNLAPLLVQGSELIANFARNVSYLMGLFEGPTLDEQIANLVGQQELLQSRIDTAMASTPDPRTNPAIASLEEEWRRVTIQLSELIAQQNEAAASAAEIQVDEENVTVLEELTLETERAGGAAKTAAELYEEMLNKIIEANPLLRDLGFTADTLGDTMKMVEGSMEDAFMSMIDGTMSAKDAFRSMARDIIAQLYRVLVVQRMVGTFSAGGGGILGSVFGALNPTGAASGRPVQAGQPYTVGEHGRELFVPQSAGRVLSVSQAQNAVGGGGGVVVNQTINVSTGVQQTVRTEIKQLMPQIAESAKQAVVDAKRRGGSYGRAFS